MICHFLVNSVLTYQGGLIKTQTIPHERARYMGCAALHPSDDNLVYHFAGRQNGALRREAWVYNLKDETFQDLRNLDANRDRAGCISYLSQTGKPVTKKDM